MNNEDISSDKSTFRFFYHCHTRRIDDSFQCFTIGFSFIYLQSQVFLVPFLEEKNILNTMTLFRKSKNIWSGVRVMVQQIQAIGAELDGLGMRPRREVVEEKNQHQPRNAVLRPEHIQHGTHVSAHVHIHTKNKIK